MHTPVNLPSKWGDSEEVALHFSGPLEDASYINIRENIRKTKIKANKITFTGKHLSVVALHKVLKQD